MKKAAEATFPMDDVSIEVRSVGDLKPDPFQARKHNARNIDLIENSLQKVGAGRSVWIDEDNTILAGNGTVEAAGNVGMERVIIVDAPPDVLIARRTRGLTHEQKRYGALADNRATDMSTWDPQALSMIVQSGLDVSDMWTADEIAPLMHADWTPPPQEPLPEHDGSRAGAGGLKLPPEAMALVARLAELLESDEIEAIRFACAHALKCPEVMIPQRKADDDTDEQQPQ